MKYIECEAAYRFAQDQLKKETGAYSKGWNNAMNVIKGALHNNDALPAADVVPVVRCGECRYRQYDALFHQSYCNGNRVTDDWYCADGERLTNCGARMDGGGDA